MAMARNLINSCICCAFFVLLIPNNESLAASSNSSQPENGPWASFKGTRRNKREICTDGFYEHNGKNCCRCAAGQRVKEHCTATSDTKCEPCEGGTYNEPNNLDKCQPCKSCEHANANLQVEEHCTPARDAKCRCKEGYYCNSDTGDCKLCQPCTICGSAGFKQDCNSTSDRVCNDESNEAGKMAGIISGVVLSILVIAGVVGILMWRKKKQGKEKPTGDQEIQNESAIEMERLTVPVVDLEPLVPEIAEKLGWKIMKDIAIRSGINKNAIQDCERNNPGHSQEQTSELLQIWVENKGRDGSVKLINILRNMKHNTTADKVLDILRCNE